MRTRIQRARTGGGAGFTLMEVLLTVLIMSMLLVMMSKMLTSARTTRDTIHNIQENQLAGPAILDLIEADLRALSTYARPRAAALRIENRVLAGVDADSIDFVTANDSFVGYRERGDLLRADVNEVGYRLRSNPELDDFLEIYRRESFGVDDEPFDGGEFMFLNEKIRAFDVQVFEEDGPDAEPIESWGTSYDDGDALPARIEITLELEFAPRLMREQLHELSIDKRLVSYKRIIRFPETLRQSLELQPVAVIPRLLPPVSEGQPGLPGAGGDVDIDGYTTDENGNQIPLDPNDNPFPNLGNGQPPPGSTVDLGDLLQGGGSGGGGALDALLGGGGG